MNKAIISDGLISYRRLCTRIDQAREAMKGAQRSDGHWLFELDPDVTISSEYLLLLHYLGHDRPGLEHEICGHIRATQSEDGSWPLFADGEGNISATVKAYYALKLAGDDPQALHMARARAFVLERGGAARANVFTRITLTLFGQVPWRAVPVMPVEIMLLPPWFPFHISKISYWSRTVVVPLLILMALKPEARNPRGVGIPELFTTPPERERRYITNTEGTKLGSLFVLLDHVLRVVEPLFPARLRQRAIDRAVAFIRERLNGEDGLGGIYPAMANAVMSFDALGMSCDGPEIRGQMRAIEGLLQRSDGVTYCQPCLSPVWDTALALHAMLETATRPDETVQRAIDWLLEREIVDVKGDWSWRRPGVAPSGWAFQYRNDHYPDLDDTAVVVMALHRADPERYREVIERASRWILELQSANGGWAAFDADNTYLYLNAIPFADHGALLDPPTVDVTARCLGMLAQLGYRSDHPAVARAICFIESEQEADGSWFGRWGVNYVYGTWSALSGLCAAGRDMSSPSVRRGVAWLKSHQREDGGWGESCRTYYRGRSGEQVDSTPSQTSWALLGLMAAGEVDSDEVRRGVGYLLGTASDGPRWRESSWTGVGFPRVFYLKYHGYSAYFPLWALARYKTMAQSNERCPRYGL